MWFCDILRAPELFPAYSFHSAIVVFVLCHEYAPPHRIVAKVCFKPRLAFPKGLGRSTQVEPSALVSGEQPTKSQDCLDELILSSHHVGPRD